jgi:23S rRNA pseudouridine2604 synthase
MEIAVFFCYNMGKADILVLSGRNPDKMEQNKERINKYLAQAGVCSRREADALIDKGRVLVNGQPAMSGMKVSPADKIVVQGREIRGSAQKLVLAFYKPVGVVCTEKDRFADKKVLDYVKTKTRVTYAGRLDKESEGLMLLTNDGELIQRMMKGSEAHEKEYVVKVQSEVTDAFLEAMQNGVFLKDLNRTTKPCQIVKEGKYTFRIVLTQGMNRQIRRMCDSFGYKVKSLKRVRIMNITLGNLKTGEARKLTGEEAAALYRAVGMPVPEEFMN